MTNQPLIDLGADSRWRLAYDNQQWVVQRRVGSPRLGKGAAVRSTGWRGVSFIGGEKRVLRRCLREAGVALTAEAETRLDALPERFLDFVVAPVNFTVQMEAEAA